MCRDIKDPQGSCEPDIAIEIYEKLQEAEADIREGRILDAGDSLAGLKRRYGQ